MSKIKLQNVLKQYKETHWVKPDVTYKQVTISQTGKVSFRGEKKGIKIGRKRQFKINLKEHPNTLIFIRQGVYKGGIGICPPEVDGCIVTENMPMFEIHDIESEYLLNYLKSPQFRNDVNKLVPIGTAQKALHEDKLLELEIPYPKKSEQDKIINKLKSIMDINLNLSNNTTNNFSLIFKLRQSILSEAVQGKLVPQDKNDEPASELLKKIKAEKEKLIKEKKIKGEKPLPPITEGEKPYELPNGWKWVRLGDIVQMIYGDGLTKDECILNGKYPVYGSNGIVGYYNEYLIDKRAIIIGRKGSSGALNISELPSWTTDVAYYVEESKNLDFKFLYYLLKSLKLEEMGKGIKPGLNRNETYARILGLPPISEQIRIVQKVDQLMQLCDQLESQVKNNQKNSEALMNAVLREAFEVE